MTAGELIRHKLRVGTLPRALPATLYAGWGRDTACDACDETITPDQVEYELDYPRELRHYCLHLHCYGIWSIARVRSAA